MTKEELEAANCIIDDNEFLLDYCRRIAQRLVVEEDVKRLREVRENLKTAKEVFRCS